MLMVDLLTDQHHDLAILPHPMSVAKVRTASLCLLP